MHNYCLYDMESDATSKKQWKTYRGAAQNCSRTQIVVSVDGMETTIGWMRRHPEWVKERLKQGGQNG